MREAVRAPVIGIAIAGMALLTTPAALGAPLNVGEFVVAADAWLNASYAKAPALVLGLATLLIVPLLALVGFIVRRFAPSRRPPYILSEKWQGEQIETTAFVEVEGIEDGPKRRPVDRQLLQIGRQKDNDICISESTVHRYHAIIERNDDHGLVITDVSGPEGNGVKLNGERVSRAGLVDGDILELGAARLRVIIPRDPGTQPLETTTTP